MSNAVHIWMKSVEERIRKTHSFAECELGFKNEQWWFLCTVRSSSPTAFHDEELTWEFSAPSLPEIMEKTNAWVDHPETVPPFVRLNDRYGNYGYDRAHEERQRAAQLHVELEKAKYEMRKQAEIDILRKLHDQKRIMVDQDFQTDRLIVRAKGYL